MKLTPEARKRVDARNRSIGVGGGASLGKKVVKKAAKKVMANPRALELMRHSKSLYSTAIKRGGKQASKGFMKASATASKLARKYK